MEYKFRLEILSPVHIGVDSTKWWNNGLDYIVDNGRVYILDTDRILRESSIDINQLSTTLAIGNLTYLKNKIRNLEEYSKGIFKLPVSGLTQPKEQPKEIRTIIKNPLTGEPIIPGSSLKGALSSAILAHIMGYNEQQTSEQLSRRYFSDEMKRYFGKPDDGSAFMRFIQVSDIAFDSTMLINTKIYNLKYGDGHKLVGGWKSTKGTDDNYSDNGLNTVYEALMPGQSAIGRIVINDELFNNINYQNKVNLQSFDKVRDLLCMKGSKGLFSIINTYTKNIIKKEIDFFKYYGGEYSSRIVDKLNSVLCQIPEVSDYNTSCVLRMAAGSGFHSVTGDWMFNDDHYIDKIDKIKNKSRGMRNERESAKSRKIAVWGPNDDKIFAPMGFVRICPATNDEITKHRQKKDDKLRLRLEKIDKQIAIETERRIKEEECIKAKQQYVAFVEKARKCYADGSLYEAKDYFCQAAAIFSLNTEDSELVNEIEFSLKKQEIEKLHEIQRKEEAENRTRRLELGLSFLHETDAAGKFKVYDFKGMKNRIDAWLKQSGNGNIPQNELESLKKALTRIYDVTKPRDRKKDWTPKGKVYCYIAKLTDIETADKIFNELNQI